MSGIVSDDQEIDLSATDSFLPDVAESCTISYCLLMRNDSVNYSARYRGALWTSKVAEGLHQRGGLFIEG